MRRLSKEETRRFTTVVLCMNRDITVLEEELHKCGRIGKRITNVIDKLRTNNRILHEYLDKYSTPPTPDELYEEIYKPNYIHMFSLRADK